MITVVTDVDILTKILLKSAGLFFIDVSKLYEVERYSKEMELLQSHLFFIALSKACKRTENFKCIRRNLSIAVPHITQVWLWTVAFFVGESLYLAKTKTVRQGIKFFYEICFWNQLKMSTLGGHKAGSLMGSRQSVYSHTSSAVRVTRAGTYFTFLTIV